MGNAPASTETLDLVRITVHSPFKKKEPPVWSFPETCPCCGDAAARWHPYKIEHETGFTTWWYKLHVPYCETCYQHVYARASRTRAVKVIAFLMTAGAFLGVFFLFLKAGDESVFQAWERLFPSFWTFIPWLIGAAVVYVGVEMLLEEVGHRATGEALPRTPNCTVPLQMALSQDTFRLISDESKFVVDVTCPDPSFAQDFLDQNAEYVEKVVRLRGTAVRTPRGDLVLKKTVPVPDEES